MAAYIVVEIQITDPVKYQEYAKLAGKTVQEFGGEYLVRSTEAETLEGGWKPPRLVILKFENKERAKAWWSSEQYREPKAMRQSASITRMVVVDGYQP